MINAVSLTLIGLATFSNFLNAAPPAGRAGSSPTPAAVDKSAKVKLGTININVEKMTVSTEPSDSSVRKTATDRDRNFDGERVFPKVVGTIQFVNGARTSSVKLSVSSGDGVYGDVEWGGLYHLYRKADTLWARFVVDAMKGLNRPIEVGTVSEDGTVKLRAKFKFVANIQQHQAGTLQRLNGDDWDFERARIYIDGIAAAYAVLYP